MLEKRWHEGIIGCAWVSGADPGVDGGANAQERVEGREFYV